MTALLEIRDLTVELPTASGWVRPVHDISLTIARGESLGIVGESGSGKTMLALALVGLLPAGARRFGEAWLLGGDTKGAGVAGMSGRARDAKSAGEIGNNLVALTEPELRSVRGREIGFVFQEPMTALNPVMRIGSQIAEAISAHHPRIARGELRRQTLIALERARVPNPPLLARQFPHQLSGGLRQRVLIAMALAAGPRLLIADEPTTALDVTVQKEILELLVGLRRELGLSLIFITHDLGVVAQVADFVAVMYAGRMVEIGPTAELLRAPRHPYTQALLRASPRLDAGHLAPIRGSVPALDQLPGGCSFEPRCAARQSECAAGVPEMRAAGPEHAARCVLIACEEPHRSDPEKALR